MAEKKYYWLRFKEDFFKQKEIKKLRKIAGGDTFTIIYLKMQLLTVKTDGVIKYDGIEDTFAEEIALELDEDVDNVKITLSFLQSTNLMEVLSGSEYLLPEAVKNIGSESDSAERVRKHRDRKALQSNGLALQCNAPVTNCNTELELKIKKEIEGAVAPLSKKDPRKAFGEFGNVLLSEQDLSRLTEKYSEEQVLGLIEKMSRYCEQKGKRYKNYYAALRNWAESEGLKQVVKSKNCEHCGKPMQEGYCRNPKCPQYDKA